MSFENLSVKSVLKKAILLVYVFLLIIVGYHARYAKRIIPGVQIGSVDVGGMTFTAARTALEDHARGKSLSFSFVHEDSTYPVSAEMLNLNYDWDGVVTRAFEVGRTGNIVQDAKDKLAGLYKTLYIGSYYDYSDDLLHVTLATIRGEVNEPAADAAYSLEGNNLIVADSRNGKKINSESFYKIFTYAFDRMDFSDKKLPVVTVYPNLRKEDLEELFPRVAGIVSKDLELKYEDDTWKPDAAQKLSFVGFSKEAGKLDLKLNTLHFESYIQEVVPDINKLPRGEVTVVEDTVVKEFNIIEEGVSVSVRKLTNNFREAFFGDTSIVEIPADTISGDNGKEMYGIYALLGEGTSIFTGSSSGRIHNLTLAAERTSGVLVPPGEVYSTNEAVGPINYSTGYDTAYIISRGRTILGTGGGVCQTSTTLFRAALNSGLPIVSRTPHAYRVSYYEKDGSPGFDATIFQPSVDFKFRNDTPNYILVQSSWDLEESTLTFKIYGTPDGRETEISEVTVTGETSPPLALYQDDPALPKGVVRQVDFAAWGATATFSRTVKREEEVLIEDSYTTRYQPWRAVFLVGTKE
jgi:vancomycin resistance protein YoaR